MPKYYLRSPLRVVSLVVLQPPRPASLPWEFGAGPVQCSDRRSVSLAPAVQSRMEMLQKSAANIYLVPRNFGRPHTPPSGARALAGGELPPIERSNRIFIHVSVLPYFFMCIRQVRGVPYEL
jgi:hypothetical protein